MSWNLLSGLGTVGWGLLGNVVAFLFVLTIVVFVHELGHFLVARRVGVKVMAFSIGFGPELLGFDDHHGTRWKVCAIPLGGYVRFFGDDDAASTRPAFTGLSDGERKLTFAHQSVGRRAAIAVAGPLANFILAVAIFTVLFVLQGKPATAGLELTWTIIKGTFAIIGRMLSGVESTNQLGGPIMIAQLSGQMATQGATEFAYFIGFLSVSIGLFNLFPIPVLDGGHLLFCGLEATMGRPLSARGQEIGLRIGFAVMAMFMIFVTGNDILRLWS